MIENSLYDKKSMRAITGKTANFKEIACDCVAFSNAEGGYIDFGIEDNEDEPEDIYRKVFLFYFAKYCGVLT